MPADVAARLDETLAGLVAEREAEQLSQERRPPERSCRCALAGCRGSPPGRPLSSSSDSAASRWPPTGAGPAGPGATRPPGRRCRQEPEGRDRVRASRAVGGRAGQQPHERQAARATCRDCRRRRSPATCRCSCPSGPPCGDQPRPRSGVTWRSAPPGVTEQAPSADAACPGPTVADGVDQTRALLDSTPAALVVRPPEGGSARRGLELRRLPPIGQHHGGSVNWAGDPRVRTRPHSRRQRRDRARRGRASRARVVSGGG